MTGNIRNLMYDEKNVACLFPGEDAAAKIAEYKALPKTKLYKINFDFF
jgi:hypothetical protein